MVDKELIRLVRAQFALDWHGLHGAAHWARVRENGLRLAEASGADPEVLELFAFLHDSKRQNDGHDPLHGHRAALFARELCGKAFELPPAKLELLMTACRGHSDGLLEGDPTVLACWDADRLDLGRAGIRPLPHLLCTDAARSCLDWAYHRSLR